MEMIKKWLFDCPQPSCGELANGYYNVGPMLADDREGPTDEDSRMHVITGVTLKDYDEYVSELKKTDAKFYLDNTVVNDRYTGFELNGKQYIASFIAKRGEIRVIEDIASTALDKFGYNVQGEKSTVLYPYGLYHDPENQNTDCTINCGMVYFIRLSDNSLFVIDAGYYFQHSMEATEGMWKFMHDITDTPNGEKIRISCWYYTHGHDDHTDGCLRLLTLHSDEIILERVMHGFPSFTHAKGASPASFRMKETVKEKYPDISCLQLHTGQKFNLADMTVEVIYAEEDTAEAVDLEKINIRDFNGTSTIIKLTVKGKTMMILGDTNSETEMFTEKYGNPEIWKSDMVQVAHHCFNYLPKMYKWIDAPFASVPHRKEGAYRPDNIHKIQDVLQYVKEDQVYYSGDATRGFEITEDGFKLIHESPVVGKEFDHSWMH